MTAPGRPRDDLPTAEARGPWRLVVCDLDGTLVVGTSVARHLDAWMGRGRTVDGLERRMAAGELSNTQVAELYAPGFRGIPRAEAESALDDVPCLQDIPAGVGLLREQGVDAVVATTGWSFGAARLASLWGFSGSYGVGLEVDAATGRFTGRVDRPFEAEDKVRVAVERSRALGAGLDQVVAIGDGASDLPLLRACGFAVALNASDDARAAADVAVEGASLLDALAAVPGLLRATPV